MKNFIITTDSTADLNKDYLIEHDIKYIGLNYFIDEEEKSFRDDYDLDIYYKKMREGSLTRTTQANLLEIRELFESFVKEGIDVLHISFSSALSGSYNSELLIAKEIMEEYEGSKIIVLDSLNASLGQGYIVSLAYQLKNQGLDIEQLADKINDLKTKMKVFLTVEDLIYLYRGGRVSKTKATMANIINIKPLIKVNEKGELEVYGKSRGRKKSIVDLVNTISEHFYDNNIEVYIWDADCKDDADTLERIMKEKLNATNIVRGSIGPTIGGHSGPGTLAVAFLGK